MLNLYQYHTQPQTLAHYEEARTRVPEIAYQYASEVLNKKPFPKAEPTILRNKRYSQLYAKTILKDPNPQTWQQRQLARAAGA